MTAAVGKIAAKKIMKNTFKEYQDKEPNGQDDLLYAYVENPKRPGKLIKVKKQIPDYIPDNDAVILAKVRRRAYRYDLSLFNFMGIRFGTSAVWGLVPLLGDTLDVFVALMLVNTARKVDCGLDTFTLIRMLINVILDYIVGLVPIAGDLADAAFKANSKNCRLLERRLDAVYKPKGGSRHAPRNHLEAQLPPPTSPATVYETFSEDETSPSRQPTASHHVQRPQPARTTDQPSRQGRWSWGRKERRPDEEMAQPHRSQPHHSQPHHSQPHHSQSHRSQPHRSRPHR